MKNAHLIEIFEQNAVIITYFMKTSFLILILVDILCIEWYEKINYRHLIMGGYIPSP